MAMTRWWKVACLLVVAGATVSGAGILAGRGSHAVEPRPQEPPKAAAGMPVAAADQGPFRVIVSDRGSLEASQTQDLASQLTEPTRIISIIPEGTRIKQGDLVCELDSSSLRDQLSLQRVASHGAEAAYQNARLAREVAELAVREYEEGISLVELAAIQGEVKLNESAFVKANDRLDRMRRSREKLKAMQARQGPTTVADLLAEVDLEDRFDSADQGLLRQKLSFEQAQARLNLLRTSRRKRPRGD